MQQEAIKMTHGVSEPADSETSTHMRDSSLEISQNSSKDETQSGKGEGGLDLELELSLSRKSSSEAEHRVYSCNFCQRKFYSSRALGGHQNAHSREKRIAKRSHKLRLAAAIESKYTSIASLPLRGSLTRSLGIRAHSSNIYRHAMFHPQSLTTRLLPENTALMTAGAARFDDCRKLSPASEEIRWFRRQPEEKPKLDLSLKL